MQAMASNTQSTIQLDDISIRVIYKDIKNLNLRVYPPDGRVQISAPRRMSLASIQRFAASKQAWIQESRKKIRSTPYQTPQNFRTDETHFLWGETYQLHVIEANQAPSVEQAGDTIFLSIRPRTVIAKRHQIMQSFYRGELRTAAAPLIENWEKVMQVKVTHLYLRSMKSRWGTCNYNKATIRLNTELAKRPPHSLEYVIIHELVHLLEPSHNQRFKALMTKYLPNWKELKGELNHPQPNKSL